MAAREAACALLTMCALCWQAQAAHTQVDVSVAAQADGKGSNLQAAEKRYGEAAALSKKLTERDLREAARLYSSSAAFFGRAGEPQRAANAAVRAGDSLNLMSSYEAAIGAYRRALVAGKGAEGATCAALTGLAWTEANMGRSVEAVRDAGLAVAACAPLKDADARAYGRAVEAEGEAEFWSAQIEKATASLTEARRLAAAAGDVDGEAMSALLLAYTAHPHDPEAARRLMASAMELWARSGNSHGAARGNLALAYFAGREGDYSAAECRSRSALAVFKRVGDHDNSAVTFNVLGMVARRSGDPEAAAEGYLHARALFISAHDGLGEAEAISGLMDVSVDRDDTRNPELYARGLELARTTHNQGLLAPALVGTGDVEFRARRFKLARASYQSGLSAARGAKNQYGAALALGRLARVAVAEGDLDGALALYAQALALEEQAGAIENVARTQYLRARIYLARRDLKSALNEVEKTIAIIERQRLRIAKFDSRAQYFAWVHDYYALYIQILMALDRTDPDGGFARRAFEASEKSKVRALIDELANAPQAANCGVPQTDTLLAPVRTQPEPLDAEAVVTGVEQIQPEMQKAGAALIEFALGEEHSFAWLVDGDSITSFELAGGAQIRRRVGRLRHVLEPTELRAAESAEDYLHRRQARSQAAQQQLRELGTMLFGAIPMPATRRLIIVPDGALQYLPFTALTTASGAPLVQGYELALLPSFNALVAMRKSTAGRAWSEDRVAVIADPLYELPGARRDPIHRSVVERSLRARPQSARATPQSTELTRALSDLHQSGGIPNLPGSRLEALSIQKILGPSRTQLTLGYDANRDVVLGGLLEHARMVHFATHGLLDVRRPENSGLVLALFNAQGHAQDGYLRVSDIHGLHLSADLVVLSSCESALGRDMGSEGIIGLPRAFLYAGAHRVIATLWKVDDEAAAMLMAHFYEQLKQGTSPTKALSEAQLELRRNPKFHDPYFWSAFFLEGEYD